MPWGCLWFVIVLTYYFYSRKFAGFFCHNVTFFDVTFSVSGSMLENLLHIASPQKQETDVSLFLLDSDTESENLSLLIQFPYQKARKQTV